MSRLPVPHEAWRESTEGDLDPDLTDEAGSDLDDWERPFEGARWSRVARVAVALALLALVVGALARLFA